MYYYYEECRIDTTPISMWLTIEIVTFYSFIGAAMLFLVYTRIFIKRYDSIDFRKQDIIEENFDIIQYIANYVNLLLDYEFEEKK